MECQTLERYDENLQPIYKQKKAYNTLDEAISVCKIMNSYDNIIHKVVSYKCPSCHKYHIGRNGKILKDKVRDKLKTERKLSYEKRR